MKATSETPKRSYKRTNDILEDHGGWLLVDISTPKFPDATMAVDRDVFEAHEGGRIVPSMLTGNRYIHAVYRCKNKIKYFHRGVIDIPHGMECDHIQHGTISFIDNRRSNLRAVTRGQNGLNRGVSSNNTSGVTGVCWNKATSKWNSRIRINGKTKHLGLFDNIEIAIGVRQQAEREYYGEYAYKGGEA